MRIGIFATILLFMSITVLVCGCSSEATQGSRPGVVLVRVADLSTGEPVAGVEVTLAGANVEAETDKAGLTRFEVPPGEYFVDARVCCVGPGFIEHHSRVTVASGKTSEVALHACLACLSSEHELVEGTVEFVGVEGGCWQIRTDDGKSYEPTNLPREFADHGLRVRVVLKLRDDLGSICMVGRIAEVEHIEELRDP